MSFEEEVQIQIHESNTSVSEIVWKKPLKNVLEDTWSKTKSFFIKEERPIGTRYESKICIILIHFTEGNNDF